MQMEWQTVQTQIRLLLGDQTAPRSSLIWVCTVCPGISVRKLRTITVLKDHNRNKRNHFLFIASSLVVIGKPSNIAMYERFVCIEDLTRVVIS